MGDTAEKLPDEPITIWAGDPDFKWEFDEIQRAFGQVIKLWEASSVPIYHITDMSRCTLDVDGLSKGAASAAFGPQSPWSHPKLRMVIVVTNSPAVTLAVNNIAKSASTGGIYRSTVPLLAMDSVEKALAYIREQRRSELG